MTFWDTGIPGPADDVFIDYGNPVASVVTITAAANAQNVTIDVGDTLVNAGQTFSIFGNSFTSNGTFNVNGNGRAVFRNGGTIVGAGGIVFDGAGTSRVDIDGNNTLTIDAGSSITGHTGVIGGQLFVGGTATIVVDGLVSANVTGGTITITESAVTNNGTLRADNGGTLVLNSNVAGNPGGQIHAATGSTVIQSGVTLSGVLNSSGSGTLRATSSGSNFLDGATLNGVLDLTAASAIERITANGLELNGRIDVDNSANLVFNGTSVLSGTGEVVLGAAASNRIDLDGTGATTIGTDVTIRGQNGTIGGQILVGGTQSLVNDGTTSADVPGGTLTLTQSAVTNNGVMRALAGATLVIDSAFTNAPGGVITGDGTVDGPAGGLENGGHVAPGQSPASCCVGDA